MPTAVLLFGLFGLIVGATSFVSWNILCDYVRYVLGSKGVPEFLIVIAQFVVFNIFVFSILGLCMIGFNILGGQDFQLRRSMGFAFLIMWFIGHSIYVFIIQEKLHKYLHKRVKKAQDRE